MHPTPDPFASWRDLRLVAVDTEGDGGRPASIVELGVVPIIAGEAGRPITWLVKPPAAISWQATRVHGLTREDVEHCPPFSAVRAAVASVIGPAPIVVAHNAHVDASLLARELLGSSRPS